MWLPLVLLLMPTVSSAAECPSTVANCDYYQRCVAAMQPQKTEAEAVAHCLAVHDKATKAKRDAEWGRFDQADHAGKEQMVREVLEKQCARGQHNSLCP